MLTTFLFYFAFLLTPVSMQQIFRAIPIRTSVEFRDPAAVLLNLPPLIAPQIIVSSNHGHQLHRKSATWTHRTSGHKENQRCQPSRKPSTGSDRPASPAFLFSVYTRLQMKKTPIFGMSQSTILSFSLAFSIVNLPFLDRFWLFAFFPIHTNSGTACSDLFAPSLSLYDRKLIYFSRWSRFYLSGP